MSKKNSARRKTMSAADLLEEFLRKRVLLPGENAGLYQELFQRVMSALKPQDAIEEMLIKDLVDIAWEINRLRKMVDLNLRNDRTAATADLLESIYEPQLMKEEGRRLAKKRALELTVGSDEARAETVGRMHKFGLGEDSIIAESFSRRIEFVEKVDRMITSAESRRNRIIREIEFRRSYLAGRLESALGAEAETTINLQAQPATKPRITQEQPHE